MNYVDGFMAAVPTTNREAFRKHAEDAAVVFKEHGGPSPSSGHQSRAI